MSNIIKTHPPAKNPNKTRVNTWKIRKLINPPNSTNAKNTYGNWKNLIICHS